MTRNSPRLIVISGPSGVGKSTVADLVIEKRPDMVRSVSVTTRQRRKSEKEGRDYFFVTRGEFDSLVEGGDLLEWAEVHGNLYGTKSQFVCERLAEGRDVLLEIDVQGGLNVKRTRPDAVMIFILPPSGEELERRLRGRGTEEEEVIRRRLSNAQKELESGSFYEHHVINDDAERCAEEILAIIA